MVNNLICKVFGHKEANHVYYGVPVPDRSGATLFHEFHCERCLEVFKEKSVKVFANMQPVTK